VPAAPLAPLPSGVDGEPAPDDDPDEPEVDDESPPEPLELLP
jgi:hypothetical protein